MLFKVCLVHLVVCASLVVSVPAGETKAAPSTTPALVPINPDTVFEIGKPPPTHNQLRNCVDEVAKRLHISEDMKSDPAIFKDILKNVMYLDDQPEIQALFTKDMTEPVSFGPLVKAVKDGISQKHPAVGTVLCAALTDPTTQEVWKHVDDTIITRAMHHTYLLEHITGKLAKDPALLRKLMPIVRSKLDILTSKSGAVDNSQTTCPVPEKAPGLTDKLFHWLGPKINKLLGGTDADWCRYSKLYDSAGIFLLAKDISVALGIDGVQSVREDSPDKITPERAAKHSRGVSINVAEATATDFLHGKFDNGALGADLMMRGFKEIVIAGDKKKVVHYKYQKDYGRLYETWNLAFITGNLHTLNLLYPKLLIPRVLYADHETYIHFRSIALWLTINWYLADEVKQITAGTNTHPKYPGQAELATLWGKINKRYMYFLEDLQKKEEAAADKGKTKA